MQYFLEVEHVHLSNKLFDSKVCPSIHYLVVWEGAEEEKIEWAVKLVPQVPVTK